MAGNCSLSLTMPPRSPPAAAVAGALCPTPRDCLLNECSAGSNKGPSPAAAVPHVAVAAAAAATITFCQRCIFGSDSDTARADEGRGCGALSASCSPSPLTQCAGQRPGAAAADSELMNLGQGMPRRSPVPSISGARLLPRRPLRGSPFQLSSPRQTSRRHRWRGSWHWPARAPNDAAAAAFDWALVLVELCPSTDDSRGVGMRPPAGINSLQHYLMRLR